MWWTYPDMVGLGQAGQAPDMEQEGLCADGLPPDRIVQPDGRVLVSCAGGEIPSPSTRGFSGWLQSNQTTVALGVGAFALLLLFSGGRR